MDPTEQWRTRVPAVAPPPALGQHVLDSLRRLVIVGDIEPGTHLVESQLSATFSVSRGPVRDALRRLEAEGLVESRRRGVFVIGLTVEDVEELYSLRQMIEGQAVRRCLTAAGPDWRGAQAALAVMQAAAGSGDITAFAAADLDFHSCFYVVAGHRRLQAVWEQYRPTFADMLAVTNTRDHDLAPTAADHADLLAAVVGRREAEALSLLATHIDGSRERMFAALAAIDSARADGARTRAPA